MFASLTGLLLAAGRSSRFGGHKGMALMADGVPMAVRSALNLKAVVGDVLCVVRADDDVLQKAFEQYGLNVVTATHAGLGMTASLQAGIEASAGSAGWVLALGDMPLIQASTYQILVDRFDETKGIVVPIQQSRHGHPVIFPARYREELMLLTGDTGARALLKHHTSHIHCVPVNDLGIFQDFDTPAAFKALLK